MASTKRAKKPRRDDAPVARNMAPNPSWYVPVMLGLMILGLLWIVTFYLSAGAYPVRSWANWNLGAGFGLIIAGFLMTTNWR
ncbi:cell division protein CrgA [Gephyromycinifex aptenodytis]|uniref:cell division protein CrgA n=1 Tax=Gephyromycinifex aptenodytis TaxID=2716227 RepID=UPI0014459A4C|nr:cell division protein CrgA [Gephyromycinifex aptenodytis]